MMTAGGRPATAHRRHRREERGSRRARREDEHPPGALGDQHAAIGREGDIPRELEAVLYDLGADPVEWPQDDEDGADGDRQPDQQCDGHEEAAGGRPRGRRQPPHATKDAG